MGSFWISGTLNVARVGADMFVFCELLYVRVDVQECVG